MKTISYSILCEDIAHEFFMAILLSFYTGDIQFKEIKTVYKFKSKNEVVARYIDVANKIFRDHRPDVLFVILDHDDEKMDTLPYHQSLHDKVFPIIKDKVIIAIPKRCIEHWLRYLQWKKENPSATKNISIEEEQRWESKIKVYGSKKSSREKTQQVINDLLLPEHVSFLASRSASFNHLYKNIEAIRENYSES